MTQFNRRDFLKTGSVAAAIAAGSTFTSAEERQPDEPKPIRVGVVGTGSRGRWHIVNMLKYQENVEVPAVCDIKPSALAAGVQTVKDITGKTPDAYGENGDEYAYRKLCERDDLDAVVASTPSKWLGRMSIDALNAGKHASHEVPGCYTIEECHEMVQAEEKSGKYCMLLENCCYERNTMMLMNMIRQGVFGEPYFGVGSYVHDCRHYFFDSAGKLTWRGDLYTEAHGAAYNPHGLGSPSKWLGINDGDRFESCICMSTTPREVKKHAAKVYGADSPQANLPYIHGDFVTTLIQTAMGREIRIDYSLSCTRPYSRYYLLQGTNGCFDSRVGMYIEGVTEKAHEKWDDIGSYYEKYDNPYWLAGCEEAARCGGHGGIDYFVIHDFVKMVRENKRPWIDVYDAATWASILHFSKLSLDRGGNRVEVDDFTGGRWKDPDWRKDAFV